MIHLYFQVFMNQKINIVHLTAVLRSETITTYICNKSIEEIISGLIRSIKGESKIEYNY